MNKILKDYFSFSKKESTAAIILLLIVGGFIVLPYVYKKEAKLPTIDPQVKAAVEAIQPKNNVKQNIEEDFADRYQPAPTEVETKYALFEFDPNTLDAAGWKRLGLRDKTITTLLNYRNKGGKFRKAEDLKKIWGLRPQEADRIIPYARIDAPQNNFSKQAFGSAAPSAKTIAVVDINTAQPEDLRHIPGMENGLQYRIVKFREKLGGFISLEQVKETYGMTDSAFAAMEPYIKFVPATIAKLNINTASDFELNAHPYINKPVAKAIALYRVQHGSYQSVADIKKIAFIKEEVFQKIAPYLTVE
ncbi:helix-hairpin-helix domain-containing protein [Parasediminibacterium paludis]|uniref:Helix-hairpin-helix domain-containing protein n=1 Tax=Parasediminibacterium paludis TaxID=908966 RepID=A0ABV8PSU5_9BACT